MACINYEALAQRLKESRLHKGTRSLRDVEDATGVSASTLSRLERVESHEIGLGHYIALCKWMNLSLDTFVIDNGSPDKGPDTVEVIRQAISRDKGLRPEARNELFKCFHTMYMGFTRLLGPK